MAYKLCLWTPPTCILPKITQFTRIPKHQKSLPLATRKPEALWQVMFPISSLSHALQLANLLLLLKLLTQGPSSSLPSALLTSYF